MTTERELRRAAREAADYAQARVSQFERELADLEKRLADAKAKRDTARLAPKRLADFQVKIGADYQCPRCWISEGVHASIRPVPSNTRDDLFGCRRCGSDFLIPPF